MYEEEFRASVAKAGLEVEESVNIGGQIGQSASAERLEKRTSGVCTTARRTHPRHHAAVPCPLNSPCPNLSSVSPHSLAAPLPGRDYLLWILKKRR